MQKTVLIIGGGIAGLAAGCYAQMNGFKTTIIEQHFLPGGLCTSWERDGYVFDGCLSYLYGSAHGMPFHDLWEELGTANIQYISRDDFIAVSDEAGQTVTAWADPDRFREHLLSISPEDRKIIDSVTSGIRKFAEFDLSLFSKQPRETLGAAGWGMLGLSMVPWTALTAKWALTSASDLAKKFRHPFLKRAVSQLFGWPEIPMLAGLSMLAYLWKGNAAFPKGGSLSFARAIEQRYLDLGGEIQYKKRVERILVEDDKAIGVRLYTDEDLRADYIISAADGRSTVFDLLGGQYGGRGMKRLYSGGLPIHSQMQLSFGVNRDLSDTPAWAIHLLNEPYRLLSEERNTLSIKHFGFDPSLSPPGKSVVEVFLRMDHGYFRRILGNRLYDAEQDQTAEQVLAIMERVIPGITTDVETTDVATPISYERYTGNWQGSSCGWLLSKKVMPKMVLGMRKTLPGLGNLYLAGQWVEPGGSVPLCAASGRNAITLMCRDAGLPFRTTKGD